MKDKCKYKCKCGKAIPIFNFKGNTNGICCSKCKEIGMVDIKNKNVNVEYRYLILILKVIRRQFVV